MRKFVLLAAVFGLVSFSTPAQEYPKVEFFGGYQFTHLDSSVNSNGWNFSTTGNLTTWFGGKADFSGTYKYGANLHLRHQHPGGIQNGDEERCFMYIQ